MSEKSQYKSLAEWRKANPKDYIITRRNGWIDEICKHFSWEYKLNKPAGYWTLEKCMEDAKPHKSKSEWIKNSSSAYEAARRNGWLDEISKKYGWKYNSNPQKPQGYWTKKRCMEDAKLYKTLKEWAENSSSAYSKAKINGWLDECTAHMIKKQKDRGYWNIKENVLADSKNYENKSEWIKNSSSAYKSARRNGWLDECTAHMIKKQKDRGYWTLEKCIEDAKPYKSKSEWKNNSTGYDAARRNGWLDECTKHMENIVNPVGYWTLEKCMEDAKPHKSKSKWKRKLKSGYHSARRNGWLDEISKIMKW